MLKRDLAISEKTSDDISTLLKTFGIKPYSRKIEITGKEFWRRFCGWTSDGSQVFAYFWSTKEDGKVLGWTGFASVDEGLIRKVGQDSGAAIIDASQDLFDGWTEAILKAQLVIEVCDENRFWYIGRYFYIGPEGSFKLFSSLRNLLEIDCPQIFKIKDNLATDALVEKKIRLHQAKFSRAVFALNGRRCAFTGTDEPCLIEAAHIFPYAADSSPRSRVLPDNGIPLSANMHRLFDDGLISVDEKNCILVSSLFNETNNLLGITAGGKIKVELNTNQMANMKRHRDFLFTK